MDSQLIARAQGGDREAFREIALQSHARLSRVAQGIVADRVARLAQVLGAPYSAA